MTTRIDEKRGAKISSVTAAFRWRVPHQEKCQKKKKKKMKTIAIKQFVSDRNRTCRASTLWTRISNVVVSSSIIRQNITMLKDTSRFPRVIRRVVLASVRRRDWYSRVFWKRTKHWSVCKLSFRKKLHLVKNSGNFTFEARNIIWTYLSNRRNILHVEKHITRYRYVYNYHRYVWHCEEVKLIFKSKDTTKFCDWNKDIIISNFLNSALPKKTSDIYKNLNQSLNELWQNSFIYTSRKIISTGEDTNFSYINCLPADRLIW